MKKESKRFKAIQQDEGIDVHDDNLMIKLGIRPPHLQPRDESVWTKTPNEKRLVKNVRRKGKMHMGVSPVTHIPLKAKLIIQLKSNKKFPNSTISTECYMHEIGNILSKYYQWKNKTNECLVIKYVYNGKTYKPTERPFWSF